MNPELYLGDKGLKLRFPPGEIQTQCPFCGDQNKAGHLYVNREHGAFMCQRCGVAGSFHTLQVLFGDKAEPQVKEFARKMDVWADMVEICQDALLDQPEAINYLRQKRGLSAVTIGKYRLGWAPRDLVDLLLKKWTIGDIRNAGLMNEENYPLFWDRIVIPYFSRDMVVTVRGKQIDGNMIQAKNTSIHLFGADNLRGHGEVVICEGEMDAMFLDQLGYASCAVPGALNFQEHWVTWFEEAKRAYVALDADEAGFKGGAKILGMLGRKARLVEFPVPGGAKSTDVTEYFLRDLHTKNDFQVLVNRARGQRIHTFGEGIVERDELLKLEGLKFGWVDLDYALHPGLLPGQVVTVLAKTGEGKTAFLSQLVQNLSSWTNYKQDRGGPGIPTLMLSLEQTKAEMSNRLERIGRLFNPWVTSDEMNQWYSSFRVCDENKIPGKDLPLLVEEFIEEVGTAPRVLMVDYLGYWARSFKGKNKYEQVSDAVMELKQQAKALGLTIIAPHQVSRESKLRTRIDLDAARDSGVVEETSDFVLSVYRLNPQKSEDETEDYISRARVNIEILKSRHGNVGRQIVMLWAPYSLAFVPRGEMEHHVIQEWAMFDDQATYEEVMEVHAGRKFHAIRQ